MADAADAAAAAAARLCVRLVCVDKRYDLLLLCPTPVPECLLPQAMLYNDSLVLHR